MIEPRFTRGEYWLLETVVERELGISELIERELELNLNKTGHGLTRSSLLESLHRLLSSGLIYAKNEVDGFISTYEQIECALNEPPWQIARQIARVGKKKRTLYGLTQKGGVQWEAFAAPDWGKYIIEKGEDEDESGCELREVICADKEWLEMFFRSMCFHDQLEVPLASIEWDYIAPWQVTYWKQLEGAHRLRFQARDKCDAENYEPSPPWNPEYFRGGWYAWR